MQSTPNEIHSSPRAGRPSKRACADCHARKVKCDGAVSGFPCSNCRSANIICTVLERRKRQRISKKDGGGSETSISGQHDGINPAVPWPPSESLRPAETVARALSHDEVQASVDGFNAQHIAAGTDDEMAKRHLVQFFSQDLQSEPIKSRLTYVGNELSNLSYLVRQLSANQFIYHYPSAGSYAPRVLRNSQKVATPSLIPKDAFVLPPKHISDILVAAYFEHVHAYFPVINRDEFMALYEDPTSAPPLLLYQAVCLVGSHVTSAFNNTHELKAAFFRRAKCLFDGRYEEDRMHMVQAALLLTWFSDGGDDVCANAWWWIGVACRIAIGLGMHQNVGPSKMPVEDKRTWRRIWWCLVQFDVLISLCYGRPQNINMDDCDVLPLCLADFDTSTSPSQANFCIQHAKLCCLISDIVRKNFSVKAMASQTDWSEAFRTIDMTLAEWLIGLTPNLRVGSWRANAHNAEPWPLMLHLTYHTVLIQFHRLKTKSSPDTLPPVDDQICADAASKIIRIFEQLDEISSMQKCWFWAPNALFTAMLQIKGQLNSGNAIIALQAVEDYDSGLHSLRQLSHYWLLAASVSRLFKSEFIKSTGRITQRQLHTAIGHTVETMLDNTNDSPSCTVSSDDFSNANGYILPREGSQNMDWTQHFNFGLLQEDSMQVQPNRWQDSLAEWQTLYWSDPLASLMHKPGGLTDPRVFMSEEMEKRNQQ